MKNPVKTRRWDFLALPISVTAVVLTADINSDMPKHFQSHKSS